MNNLGIGTGQPCVTLPDISFYVMFVAYMIGLVLLLVIHRKIS
jgi:hypothetical protein